MSEILQCPALVVTAPLIGACLVAIAGWVRRSLCFPLAMASLLTAGLAALKLAWDVLVLGPISYHLGGWPPPWGIAYEVDGLNAVVLVMVAWAAVVNLVAARAWVGRMPEHKRGAFYALYVLSATGLMGIVVTGDLFNLYVLLEIASLSGYALVAMGDERAPLVSLNYVFLGTVGACFYLLGVGFIYIMTGSLNMADVARLLVGLRNSPVIWVAFCVIIAGVWLKAAFFPLHAWLPRAYSHAPIPAAGLLAPTMTKVMIYVMIRLMTGVFGVGWVMGVMGGAEVVVWMAVVAMIVGAIMALRGRTLRQVATWLIVSEVAYMVGGAWVGNRLAMTGAVLHLINDCAMTLCVMLAIGGLAWALGGEELGRLEGAFAKAPWSMGALVGAALAMIGVPPTCGFFSKWYLLLGGMAAGRWEFVVGLVVSSLLNIIVFFRLFERALFTGESHHAPAMAEAPVAVVAPAVGVALGLVVLGLYNGWIVTHFIEPLWLGRL